MRVSIHRRAALLALWCGWAWGEPVKHQLPQLASVFPQGAERGSVLSATVLGNHLDRASTLLFAQAGISGRIVEGSHTRLTLELEVAEDADYGPHYFRAISPRGASNVLLFRVGDQRHLQEAEPNGRLEQAWRVEPPLTVNGRLDRAQDIDIFRFEARPGEGFVFDLRAARNGSGLDASMILLDSAGNKLRHSEEHFIWDPFFGHTIRGEGTHFLVLQPTRGRARPTHGYQLDIRKAPHLRVLAPLGIRAGASVEAVLFGTGLDLAGATSRFETCSADVEASMLESGSERARIRLSASEQAPDGECHLTLVTGNGRSNQARFWVHDLPAHPGGESLSVPIAISGNARSGRPERYLFEATKGETLAIEVKAHQLGSAVDMTLELAERDTAGGGDDKRKVLATNDDAKPPGTRFAKDPKIVHEFEDSGTFELLVSNLWRVTGDGFPYHLEVRPPEPRMVTLLATDQPVLHPGKTGKLDLEVHRLEGHAEPATLSVLGLPQGIRAKPILVPAPEAAHDGESRKPQKVTIEFTGENLEAGTFAPIQVVADGGGPRGWRNVRIASGGGEGATYARISGAVLAVAEERAFELEAQLRSVNLVRGGIAEIPVSVRMVEEYEGEIAYSVENLPGGVSVQDVASDNSGAGSRITLRAAPDATEGSYSAIAVIGTDSDGHSEQAPTITLVVD